MKRIVLMSREPVVKEKLATLGVVVPSSRSEELAIRNSADAALWKKLIEVANIKVE